MNMKVCDVCWMTERKISQSKYRVGWSHSIKIDVCDDHHNFFADTKSPAEALTLYAKLESQSMGLPV